MELQEFDRMLASERACQEHFANLRWFRKSTCPECSWPLPADPKKRPEEQLVFLPGRDPYLECPNPGCRAQWTPTAGTMLHGSRVPLRVWFDACLRFARGEGGFSIRKSSGLPVSEFSRRELLRVIRIAAGEAAFGESLDGQVEIASLDFPQRVAGRTRARQQGDGKVGTRIGIAVGHDGTQIKGVLLRFLDSDRGDTLSSFITLALTFHQGHEKVARSSWEDDILLALREVDLRHGRVGRRDLAGRLNEAAFHLRYGKDRMTGLEALLGELAWKRPRRVVRGPSLR